jgi:hypothetical protein
MSSYSKYPESRLVPIMFTAVILGACADEPQPTAPDQPASHAASSVPAPPGLRYVSFAGQNQMIWPYTTAHFPAHEQDPVNLIFVGQADPRNIRAALLALNGNRPHFPPAPMFACTWRDAIGGHQAAYSNAVTWIGSAIQLECGEFQSVRFHLRIFSAGAWTLVNAHLDVLIPGTTDHEVIAWELARQLVVYDFQRSGLLAPGAPLGETEVIHPRVFRQIHPAILAGLPPDLLGLLLQTNSIMPDGRLMTSGRATILNLDAAAPAGPTSAFQEVPIQFNQVIPKPFCNGGNDFVLVQGPVRLQQRVERTPDGTLSSLARGAGQLTVIPFDPATGQPIGPPSRAEIAERYLGVVTDQQNFVTMWQLREALEGPIAGQRLTLDMRVGPQGDVHYARNEHCGS